MGRESEEQRSREAKEHMSREALRQMGRFAGTATLSAAPSANVFLQCTVIIHFGMLSWLTNKKYIRLTAISKRPAANGKFAINSFQQPSSLLFIGYFGSHKLEIFVLPAIILIIILDSLYFSTLDCEGMQLHKSCSKLLVRFPTPLAFGSQV